LLRRGRSEEGARRKWEKIGGSRRRRRRRRAKEFRG